MLSILFRTEVKDTILVTFTDASERAYGATVYQRTEYVDGQVTVRLVAAQAKVTPLAAMSIPKAELAAAGLGLRLSENICETLGTSLSEIRFFSDSYNVLWWIKGHGKKHRPFVKSLIGEIQQLTNLVQWQKVHTKENPADLCSRGVTADKLRDNKLYWQGPEFLQCPVHTWPVMKTEPPSPSQETRITTVICNMSLATTVGEIIDLGRVSKWTRLRNIIGWVLRFIANSRERLEDRIKGPLHQGELDNARKVLIKQAQSDGFREELRCLNNGPAISNKSKVANLTPRLDTDKVLRAEGRLQHAEVLPYETRYPVLLPRGHRITQLIVDDYHNKLDHNAGIGHMLSEICATYWIPGAREEIREADSRKNAKPCRKRKARPARQIMAPLHVTRQGQEMRAFADTSVDFAGPFLTVQGRGRARQKRWICLFTCAATRAIHLELAHGLDTDSFVRSFMRFVGRRGLPTQCTSDCGTNFQGASKLIDIDPNALITDERTTTVKWNFNPPAAPHFGGIHEISVKAVKQALPKEMHEAPLTDEELNIIGVEDFLNARPLTYQTADIRDALPLTPNRFFHGRMGGKIAPSARNEQVKNPRERWRRVQGYISKSWTRFLKELLPMLNPRTKWYDVVANIKVDDLVIVLDNQLPRAQWPMGRVTEIYEGKDEKVRVAKVLVGRKTVTRPIVKLIPLNA